MLWPLYPKLSPKHESHLSTRPNRQICTTRVPNTALACILLLTWANGELAGEWHVGFKRAFDLFPKGLQKRIVSERRKRLDEQQRDALTGATAALDSATREVNKQVAPLLSLNCYKLECDTHLSERSEKCLACSADLMRLSRRQAPISMDDKKRLDELEERVKLLKDLDKFEDPGEHPLGCEERLHFNKGRPSVHP